MKKIWITIAVAKATMCAFPVYAHAQTAIPAEFSPIETVYVEGDTLGNFHIGKYEITQAQWQAVMGSNPSHFKNCPNCPVESVSWNDVQEFIKKLNAMTGKNYRLPTEAEWEYAARGGESYEYSGNSNVDAVAWYADNSDDKTHEVGSKQANAYGIYDMSGNVREWCQYDTSRSFSVLRGGGWRFWASLCRVDSRQYFFSNDLYSDIGFRVLFPVDGK